MIKFSVSIDGETFAKRNYVSLEEGLAELQTLYKTYIGENV